MNRGLPASYDAWRTASPWDYQKVSDRCTECGEHYDDHIDKTDHEAVAEKRREALEAIGYVVAGNPPSPKFTGWTVGEIAEYGLSAVGARGVSCRGFSED